MNRWVRVGETVSSAVTGGARESCGRRRELPIAFRVETQQRRRRCRRGTTGRQRHRVRRSEQAPTDGASKLRSTADLFHRRQLDDVRQEEGMSIEVDNTSSLAVRLQIK